MEKWRHQILRLDLRFPISQRSGATKKNLDDGEIFTLRPSFLRWRLWTPHLDLCFTRSQRLGATSDDRNDGLVFYESLQHPKTVSEGPKRLPQVKLCASERPPGGPDPVSWALKITHSVIPPISKWSDLEQKYNGRECKLLFLKNENCRSSPSFFVIFVVHATLASCTLSHMGKKRSSESQEQCDNFCTSHYLQVTKNSKPDIWKSAVVSPSYWVSFFGGRDPVSWTLKITHLVIPTISKWRECEILQKKP